MTAFLEQVSKSVQEKSRQNKCLMAKTGEPSSQQVAISKIREDMYSYDRDDMLDCLETMLDEILALSTSYKEGKKNLKKKTEEYKIASASCDHLQDVWMQLKDEKAELEVTLDQCKVELEIVKTQLHQNDFSDDEGGGLIGPLVVLSQNPEDPINFTAAKERAKNLSKPDLLQALNLLLDDVQELHSEFVKTKAALLTVPPAHPALEISKMIDKYEGQVCDLACEIHELKKGKQDSFVNVINESAVSSLKMDFEKFRIDFKCMDERNVLLLKILETRDKELEKSQNHVNKLLTARSNLDHKVSIQGNNSRTGLGYTARRNNSNWSPKDTTWVQEIQER